MKLEDDFSSMFLILDTTKKGFLTDSEVANFYQTLFNQNVDLDLTNAVIRNICSSVNCTQKDFQSVLLKLEEWRQRENNAYWDFMSLDKDGSGVIPTSNALFLARSVKGGEFSLDAWTAWLDTRDHGQAEVCWDDFKQYLYFEPATKYAQLKNESEYHEAYDSLSNLESTKAIDEYQFYKASLESDDAYSALLLRERQQYQDDVHYQSGRLVNRWNVGGVEAVIHDDGAEWEIIDNRASKDDVTTTDFLAALDEKYDAIRDKLLWEMVKTQTGNDTDRKKISQQELGERFSELKIREKDMRKTDTLDMDVNLLYGTDVSYGRDIHVLMGETADAYQAQWDATKRRYAAYKSEGKTTEEVNEIFEKENMERMKNSATTSGDMLVKLWVRQKDDRHYLLEKLKHLGSMTNGQSERVALFTALYRQCERAREGFESNEDYATSVNFEGSASGVAVAERKQIFEPTRFVEDSIRQERLASERIRITKLQRKLQEPPDVGDRLSDISQVKDLGVVGSWMEIAKLLEKKHNAEREMMIHFIQTIGAVDKNVQKLDVQEQQNRRKELAMLFDSWKEKLTKGTGKDVKASQPPYQLALLHEGIAIYREELRRTNANRRENELAAMLLSRLQVQQDVQYQESVEQLKNKSIYEIYQVRKAEYRAIRDEHFESIAQLVFGSQKLSADEQRLSDVILKKYDILREKLFLESLKDAVHEEDREKSLQDSMEEEKKQRGNSDALNALCKRLKITYSAKELFGPLFSRFRMAALANQDSPKTTALDEMTILDGNEKNILSELQARYTDESQSILRDVRESNDVTTAIRRETEKQMWHMVVLESDKVFISSAMSLGLFERSFYGKPQTKLRQDMPRYIECAQERFPIAQPFNEEANLKFNSERDEVTAAMRLLAARHTVEWKHLRVLMTDATAEELREAASLMTSDERVKRLAEINAKRKSLDISTEDGREDMLSLLEEAAALKHVSRKEILRHLVGDDDASDDDVSVSLLADLHETQISDGIHWFFGVAKSDQRDAASAINRIEFHMNACENIFHILCKYEGTADDEHLLQALEDKYDTLRDKLLTEALMRQMGDAAWRRLSEKERQERLMKLKLEEMRLRKEGKLDELARLLGDAFANDARMKALLGESRELYEKKLRERLEARKRGESVTEEDIEDIAVANGVNNPLVDLASRLDEERDALMRMLSGQDDLYMSEKERQAALLRLRQSRLKAEGEDRYDAAALVSGLAGREAAAEKRLKSDRERQRELARQRLADLKKRAGRLPIISEEDEAIIREGDRALLEEAVLKKLRFLQSWERAWLSSLLNENKDPVTLVGTLSAQQTTDKLQACRSRVPHGFVAVQDHHQALSDAALYRQVAVARHAESTEQSRDELNVILLAELQETQDANESLISGKFAGMSDNDLITEQENLVSRIKSGSSENIPDALFATLSASGDDIELKDALKGKYDAIVDALAAKVLPQKVGISNWDKMSPDEQRDKISDLSSRVKELMAAGRYDDALELLGEGLTAKEREGLMNALLGDAEERRQKDLQEREMRRDERIKNGMSPEEADRLFKEEELLFENKEKKRRRNVLEGLAMDMDAEKDALLKSLKDAKDKLDAERRRQAQLAKIRLQERLLRRESNLSAIAKLLAMSHDQDGVFEKEKQRQLALARDRIEAMKRRRAAGITEEEEEEFELRLDSDDAVVLADAVMREMEAKHASERSALLKLMELAAPGGATRKRADEASSTERKDRTRVLREMRRQWRNEDPQTMQETKDEHWDILKEASALQLSSLASLQSASEDEGHTYLLADLQQEQKKETSFLLSGLLEKKPETIRRIAMVQRQARADGWHDNVAGSLLGSSGVGELKEQEEEVVKALEEKYDALKDKLLAEALVKKLGETEWASLSEKERQRRIMQIKQQERKLRREGKYDEVARLFNALAITEDDINRIFGEERSSQEDALKKRRERLMQLRQEKESKGLNVDDDALGKEVDEEEAAEKQKRKNVLLTLDRNLESEREALLADLRRQDELVSEERRRQLALAKLRRERRQMEAEEKMSAIAHVFQTAKKDEAAFSASLAATRERQAALAKERLASRKTQRQRKQAIASLTDPSTVLEKLNAMAGEQNEGSSTERLFVEMEKKHADEKESLMLLLLAADDGQYNKRDLGKLSNEDVEKDLEEFAKHRHSWREERLMRAIGENSDIPLTPIQRGRLSRYVSEQNKDLIQAMVMKTEARVREYPGEEDATSLRDKVGVQWLTELQRTQENEMSTTTDLIADKTDEILDMLTQDQKRARREGWYDNIGKVVFELTLPGQDLQRPASASSSLQQEEKELDEEAREKMKEIDEELIEQKKRIEQQRLKGEDIDADAAFTELEKQFAKKKSALTSDLERQRTQMRERLRERRQRKDESEYEAHAAVGMVLLAEQRLKARDSRAKSNASKQRNLMQERLAARREKRRMEQELKEKKDGDPETPAEGAEPAAKKQTLSPFDAMRREKTVIDVKVTDKEKDEILATLTRRSKQYQDKMKLQQEQQKDKVQQRRARAKQRKENVAEEMLTLHEREKTIIQERKSTNLTRQKTMLIERLEKLKTERTMTMKEKSNQKVRDFSKMVDGDDVEGLDKDEAMKKIAQELQKKLVEENAEEKQQISQSGVDVGVVDIPPTSDDINPAEDLPPRPQTSSRKLDKQDKDRIIKERMQKRKGRRERQEQEENEVSTEVNS